MQYDELDRTTRLNLVKARIRLIEQNYFSLNLRIQAPDMSTPISEQDRVNLAQLENSLSVLKQMEKDLETEAPQLPAPTPATESVTADAVTPEASAGQSPRPSQ